MTTGYWPDGKLGLRVRQHVHRAAFDTSFRVGQVYYQLLLAQFQVSKTHVEGLTSPK